MCHDQFLNPGPLGEESGALPATASTLQQPQNSYIILFVNIWDGVLGCFPAAKKNANYTKHFCAGTKEDVRARGRHT